MYNVRKMLGLGQQRIVSDESASYGFICKAENVIFSTESGVLDNAQVFIWVNLWIAWALGWFWDGRVYVAE